MNAHGVFRCFLGPRSSAQRSLKQVFQADHSPPAAPALLPSLPAHEPGGWGGSSPGPHSRLLVEARLRVFHDERRSPGWAGLLGVCRGVCVPMRSGNRLVKINPGPADSTGGSEAAGESAWAGCCLGGFLCPGRCRGRPGAHSPHTSQPPRLLPEGRVCEAGPALLPSSPPLPPTTV